MLVCVRKTAVLRYTIQHRTIIWSCSTLPRQTINCVCIKYIVHTNPAPRTVQLSTRTQSCNSAAYPKRPGARTKFRQHCFAGHIAWNSLSDHPYHITDAGLFKRSLETELFQRANWRELLSVLLDIFVTGTQQILLLYCITEPMLPIGAKWARHRNTPLWYNSKPIVINCWCITYVSG